MMMIDDEGHWCRLKHAQSKTVQQQDDQLGDLLLQHVRRTAWNVWSTDLPDATSTSVHLESGMTQPQRHAKVTVSYYQILIINHLPVVYEIL